MIYPKFISKNGCIGVPAPSAGADTIQRINKMNKAKENLENLGYNLILSENLYNNKNGRSASAKVRADEINDMLKNKDIDMILCAAGGEFLVEMLPYVNYDLIKNNPKFVAGFSDSTGLVYPITTLCDVATIYGQNFGAFGTEKLFKDREDFLNIINGNILEEKSYSLYEEEPYESITGLEGDNFTEPVYWKTLNEKPAYFKGRIIGGCLDLISELAGTKYDGINGFNKKYEKDGIIWYFDNCEFSMEETIRALWKFNELNYFKYTKGVIFGRFGINKTYVGYDVKSCLKDSVIAKLNVPIIYDVDISHKPPCLTIINGAIATINVEKGKGTIKFNLE